MLLKKNSSPKSRVKNIEANRSHGFKISKGLKCLQRCQESMDLNLSKWLQTWPSRNLSPEPHLRQELMPSPGILVTSRWGYKSSNCGNTLSSLTHHYSEKHTVKLVCAPEPEPGSCGFQPQSSCDKVYSVGETLTGGTSSGTFPTHLAAASSICHSHRRAPALSTPPSSLHPKGSGPWVLQRLLRTALCAYGCLVKWLSLFLLL